MNKKFSDLGSLKCEADGLAKIATFNWKQYVQLMKLGIVMGNAVTVVGGFILASKGHIDIGLFLATLMGLCLVISSGCIFNNYFDRFVDGKMERTQNRPLVQGVISVKNAVIFGAILLASGFFLLATYTNWIVVGLAALGFIVYVFMYTLLKTRTVYCTAIGSIAGAVPLVAGYSAVTGRLDFCALILFVLMVTWQMPHFFAIAIYRFKDYQAAAIQVLPVKKGYAVTKVRMLLYVIAFTLTAAFLTFSGYTGYVYLAVALGLGLWWLVLSIKGLRAEDTVFWARQMFKLSLVVITTLCIMIAIDYR